MIAAGREVDFGRRRDMNFCGRGGPTLTLCWTLVNGSGAVEDFLIGDNEVHGNVVRFARDGGGEELLGKAEAAADALEILAGEEAVIEAFAAADAEAFAVEGHAGDDDEVDEIEGDDFSGEGFADGVIGAGVAEAGVEAGEFDGFHFFIFPVDAGGGDGFAFLPGFDGEGGGFDFGGHGEVDHEEVGAFKFGRGDEVITGVETAGVALFGGEESELVFHIIAKEILGHDEYSILAAVYEGVLGAASADGILMGLMFFRIFGAGGYSHLVFFLGANFSELFEIRFEGGFFAAIGGAVVGFIDAEVVLGDVAFGEVVSVFIPDMAELC